MVEGSFLIGVDLPGGPIAPIPVRNQGNIGICYAETAAQLIDAYRSRKYLGGRKIPEKQFESHQLFGSFERRSRALIFRKMKDAQKFSKKLGESFVFRKFLWCGKDERFMLASIL